MNKTAFWMALGLALAPVASFADHHVKMGDAAEQKKDAVEADTKATKDKADAKAEQTKDKAEAKADATKADLKASKAEAKADAKAAKKKAKAAKKDAHGDTSYGHGTPPAAK